MTPGGEVGMEQRARLTPVAFDGPIRTSQHPGGLFDRQAGKVPQLDDSAEPFVQSRQRSSASSSAMTSAERSGAVEPAAVISPLPELQGADR